jgi:hypothetical protein
MTRSGTMPVTAFADRKNARQSGDVQGDVHALMHQTTRDRLSTGWNLRANLLQQRLGRE